MAGAMKKNKRLRWVAYALIPLLGMLSGCGEGKRPFLMVQTCLGDERNVVLFENMLRIIAQSKNMTYLDGSKKTQDGLARLKASPSYRLIYVGVDRNDGMGLYAGNLGLSAYEVAIGFSEGSNPSEAHQFANLVVRTLKERWRVDVVPQGQGALPMNGCAKVLSTHAG
jgi:hypothetical protein